MKLRLLNDSIRLRLSQSEVTAVAEQGRVEGQTRFPGGSVFRFALQALPAGQEASAAYQDDCVVVQLPAADINAWANDNTAVSLRGEPPLEDGGHLKLLVEKDFKCVTVRDDEDQSDLFVNPEVAC